jgi:iron complex outermembrane receptor protein
MPHPPASLRAARAARAVLAAAAVGVPAAAAAQAPAAPDSARRAGRDSTARALAPVVVAATRTPAAVGGSSAVVVRPGLLPLPVAPAPTLDQVLRQTPFVLVRQNSRGEAELSVRGSDSRQAAVLVDGLPLTLGWDHRADPSLVPSTGVERVTLVRGLASLLAGPNTLGGVIAVDVNAPAAAADDGRPARGITAATLGTGVDQYSARVATGTVTGAAAAGRAGTLTVRGGASYRQRDGFALSRRGAAGAGTTGGAGDPGAAGNASLRTNTDLRQVDGFAAARLDAPSGAFVGVTASAYQARRGVAPELHVEEPRLWRYPDASRRLAVLSAGTGDRATPLGRGGLEVSAGAHQGAVEIESFAARDYAEVASRELGRERTATARVAASHTLPAGGRLRAALTGAGVRYDETLGAEQPGARPARYRQRLASAGAEAEWPLGRRALVGGGVVRDAARTPESGGRTALGTLSHLGWRAGATVFAGDGVRLHAAASRRARFPALRELYSGALNRFDPNPGLRPERLLGVEAGATLAGGAAERAGLSLQAVAFRHRLDDAVVRVTLPNRLFRRVNRDELRSTGVELLAGWTPPAWGGVSFTGDLLAQRVRVTDRTLPAGVPNVNRPEHQPELRGSFAAGAPLPLGVRASALARYTGRQYCQHPDLGRQVALRAGAAGDAALAREWAVRGARGAGARLLGALRATLAVDNLTDATVYDQCGLPQPGRTVRVGLELR